jgi:hypothetical protein
MARSRRSFASATSYHVTMRCNNQAFDLPLIGIVPSGAQMRFARIAKM